MPGHRDANCNWDTSARSWEAIQVAVLCDIRVELQKLNGLLHCHNAVDIPNILRRIEMYAKPKPRKRRKR